MGFTTTSFHKSTRCLGEISLSIEQLGEGRLSGEIELEAPQHVETSITYILEETSDVLVAPYQVSVRPKTRAQNISLRITGPDPRLRFHPESSSSESELPTYHFRLPPVYGIQLCHTFLQHGLSDELHEDIQETYDHDRSSLLGFITQAKYCLDYPRYIGLLDAAASVDELVRRDLTNSRHKFMKNLVLGRKAGTQFPIRNHAEFTSRVAEYEKSVQLKSLDQARIIEEVVDEASNHDTHIDDICFLEESFAEVAPDLSTGIFVNILSESLLTDFEIGTVTKTFGNSFGLSAREFVNQRYEDWTVTGTFEELNQAAYNDESIEAREQALAACKGADLGSSIEELLNCYTGTLR